MATLWPQALFAGRSHSDSSNHAQYAAVPWIMEITGERKLALVTSRDTGRWVFPKGWPMPGKLPHEVAEREAREEAGLIGIIDPTPIGSYVYRKRLHVFTSAWCKVDLYLLQVSHQLVQWPERSSRRIGWFSAADAAGLVGESDLARLLRSM